jgi:hypothetical protein
VICVAPNKVIHTAASVPSTSDIRTTLIKHSTATNDDFVFDKATGELLGSYTYSDYTPESFEYPAASEKKATSFIVTDDGSPVSAQPVIESNVKPAKASVLQFTESRLSEAKPEKRQKHCVYPNLLFVFFQSAKLDGISMPWLNDYIHGAINTGPGIVNGRYSVSPSDVARMFYLPEISVDTAMGCLVNHDSKAMSVRQLQRVVSAARIALRGIALYLERKPGILRSAGVEIDFERLWPSKKSNAPQRKEHPKKIEVLGMLADGRRIKSISRQTGVSKNTIKNWLKGSVKSE